MEVFKTENSMEEYLIQKATRKHIPLNSSIELLPLCNMNCDMCFVRLDRTSMKQQGRLRTPTEWLEIGRQIRDAGALYLLLTGGEPLLYPGFREVYLGMKELGMILTVNTNGTLLDEEWADFFAKYPPRKLNITLYGASEATYAKLCHYPEGFQKAVRAIRLLKERKVDVMISGTITPANLNDIEGIHAIARELDCPVAMEYYIVPATRERTAKFSTEGRITPQEAAAAQMRILRCQYSPETVRTYAKEKVTAIRKLESQEASPDKRHFTCISGSCSFTINWQGFMRPCVIFDEPSVSVLEHGVANAWKQIHETCGSILLNEECTCCHYRPICRTCPAAAAAETGETTGKPLYLCHFSKALYELLCKEEETDSL